MRNLILARAAKDNHAERVILVEDDLFYSAQDRGAHREGAQDRPDADLAKFDGQPFTSRLYAELLKAAGVDTVMTVHIHSHRVQKLFSEVFGGDFHDLIPSEVYAHYVRHSDFVDTGPDGRNLVLCAPDKGAAPFVGMVARDLGLPGCRTLIVDKERSGEREVSMKVSRQSECSIDDLAGKDVIILDDMVRTGTTIVECANLLRTGKPRRVCFCVTHFHPSEEARENLSSRLIDEILTTSTIPSILNRDCQGRLRRKLAVLKIGRWVSRRIVQLLGVDEKRPGGDLYSVDMSSKNPRWTGAGAA
jgi:ribose-phosphate pyrophosphokinase